MVDLGPKNLGYANATLERLSDFKTEIFFSENFSFYRASKCFFENDLIKV